MVSAISIERQYIITNQTASLDDCNPREFCTTPLCEAGGTIKASSPIANPSSVNREFLTLSMMNSDAVAAQNISHVTQKGTYYTYMCDSQ